MEMNSLVLRHGRGCGHGRNSSSSGNSGSGRSGTPLDHSESESLTKMTTAAKDYAHHADQNSSFESDDPMRSEQSQDLLLVAFSRVDIVLVLFSIATYVVDIGTDVAVAALHGLNGDEWYCRLTLFFIIVPNLITSAMSFHWLLEDTRQQAADDTPPEPSSGRSPISGRTWILWILLHVLQMAPILRYVNALRLGLKSRSAARRLRRRTTTSTSTAGPQDLLESVREFRRLAINEQTDAAFLRLLESCTEAAPQLVLQLYILAVKNPTSIRAQIREAATADDRWDVLTDLTQILSILVSLVSLAWTIVSYHRVLRLSKTLNSDADSVAAAAAAVVSWPGTAVQFLWHLSVIAARMLALALFASVYRTFVVLLVFVHWMISLVWIRSMNTQFCGTPTAADGGGGREAAWEEFGFNLVLAAAFIFTYLNPVDTPTRYRYAFYYAVTFVENSLLILMWYTHEDTVTGHEDEVVMLSDQHHHGGGGRVALWYRLPALVSHYLLWLSGLLCMATYYLLFHPRRQNRSLDP